MENKIYEKWLLEVAHELSMLDGLDVPPLERFKHALPLVSKVIASVKEQVIKEGFVDNAAEIYFFKKIKPKFYALQLWETLFYSLSSQTPIGTREMIKTFYEQELLQVFHYLKGNSFHYQYFKTDASEMDHVYFLRDAHPSEIPVLELVDPFPGFSTSLDYSFAKFIAYERLRDYLLELITDLYSEPKFAIGRTKLPTLKWTGDTINLVELGYGLWLTGQINNGDAGVAEIIQALESAFHVIVGRAYRRWQSISQRKRISPVKYLDQMRKAVLKKVEEEYQ